MEAFKLKATNTRAARKEAAKRWPKNDVQLIGYRGEDSVYLSLVRNVTHGPVATATKGITPNRFEAKPVGEVIEAKSEGVDKFREYFNDELERLKDMEPMEISKRHNELGWIVFEAKARIEAINNEITRREKALGLDPL